MAAIALLTPLLGQVLGGKKGAMAGGASGLNAASKGFEYQAKKQEEDKKLATAKQEAAK
jgi:hypothetical protein